MSIAAHSLGESSVSAQADRQKNGRGVPPPKRTVIAQSDTIAQPEAR